MWRYSHTHPEGVQPVSSPGRFPIGRPLDTMNDTAFDALADDHRRNLLVALREENPQDAAVHGSTDGDPGSLKTARRVETTMYHTHLPKLVDYGYIEWDTGTGEIVKGPQFEELQPLLDCLDEYTER